MFAVDEDGDATVGVESNEPRFLLTVGGEIDPLDSAGARSEAAWCKGRCLLVVYDVAISGLELFEQNGHLVSVWSRCGVEQEGL